MWKDEFTHHEVKKDQDQDLTQIERNARELADSVANLLGREVGNKKEEFKQMKEKARDSAEEAKQYLVEKKRETDQMVHDNPWGAVAIAAVIGAVLGSIMAAKKRKY